MRDIHSKDVIQLYIKHEKVIEANRKKLWKAQNNDWSHWRIEECDDMEDMDSLYIDEETTAEEDIQDFEKKMKAEAKRMLNNYNAGSSLMDANEYLEILERVLF